MSNLPVFRRFTIADYPNAPDYMQQFFSPLNTFCEQTVNVLNRNLSIGQNLQGQKLQTKFTTATNYSSGVFTPIQINYIGSGQPDQLLVGRVQNINGSTILTAVTVTDWFLNINKFPAVITINYIAGLSDNQTYIVNLLAL
jgi:hypothetical protein